MSRITILDPSGVFYTTQLSDAIANPVSRSYSETQYSFVGANGSRVVFRGEFDVDAYGDFWRGTATSIDIYDNEGMRQATITEIALEAEDTFDDEGQPLAIGFVNLENTQDFYRLLGPMTIRGGAGADYLYGVGNADTMYGGGGGDILQGNNNAANSMYGEAGDDTIESSAGGDLCDGGTGIDTIDFFSFGVAVSARLDTARAQIIAGGVAVTLKNIENIRGTNFDDTFIGTRFANVIDGRDGYDTLNGGLGDDLYILRDSTQLGQANFAYDIVVEVANGGVDTVELGKDIISGYTLTDNVENIRTVLNGSTVQEFFLTGNALANVMTGNLYDDTLAGLDGADTLDGRAGYDRLEGGLGDDRYILNGVDAARDLFDVVVEAADAGIDLVEVASTGATTVYTLSANVENLTVTSNSQFLIDGNALANVIIARGRNDRLSGLDGDDTLTGGAGADTIDGGAGFDTADYAASAVGVMVNLTTGLGLRGEAEGDSISSVERVVGSAFDDMLIGFTRAETFSGGDGADRIAAGQGDDTLLGGAGADMLTGNAGLDRLTGGLGADRFIFGLVTDSTAAVAGRDVVLDFKRAEADRIDISAIDASTATTGNQAFAFIGTQAFHNVAGELRYQTSGANLFVTADVNGDAVADFSLLLAASTTLAAADFIL